jgi:HSP20 family protein
MAVFSFWHVIRNANNQIDFLKFEIKIIIKNIFEEFDMTLVRLEPFRGFEQIAKKFNNFASDIEKGISFEMGGFSPRIDITEDDKNLFIHAEIPGMVKEEVKISVNEERTLKMSGIKKKLADNEGKSFLRNERVYGEFERSLMLPDNLDIENINAKYDNGVLELTIPKVEPPKPKEIVVEIK